METILSNEGFLHLVEHIFGYLDHETIEICRIVSNHWDGLLERLSLVKYLLEFGDKKIEEDIRILEKDTSPTYIQCSNNVVSTNIFLFNQNRISNSSCGN